MLTHSNQNYFLQSSDMIDSLSNNVHSVRKDDFELDRNINQIDQKVPHFKNFVEELQYKIAHSLQHRKSCLKFKYTCVYNNIYR